MDPDHARGLLEDERQRLERLRTEQLENLQHSEMDRSGELSSFDQHPGDLGTDTFEREKDLSIVEQLEAELEDVERAMRRVEDGTYGRCEVDGEPIPDERLEALPAARFCVRHQSEVDRAAEAERQRR
jgi:RNA polymerase-binding transcription factor DksA